MIDPVMGGFDDAEKWLTERITSNFASHHAAKLAVLLQQERVIITCRQELVQNDTSSSVQGTSVRPSCHKPTDHVEVPGPRNDKIELLSLGSLNSWNCYETERLATNEKNVIEDDIGLH